MDPFRGRRLVEVGEVPTFPSRPMRPRGTPHCTAMSRPLVFAVLPPAPRPRPRPVQPLQRAASAPLHPCAFALPQWPVGGRQVASLGRGRRRPRLRGRLEWTGHRGQGRRGRHGCAASSVATDGAGCGTPTHHPPPTPLQMRLRPEREASIAGAVRLCLIDYRLTSPWLAVVGEERVPSQNGVQNAEKGRFCSSAAALTLADVVDVVLTFSLAGRIDKLEATRRMGETGPLPSL